MSLIIEEQFKLNQNIPCEIKPTDEGIEFTLDGHHFYFHPDSFKELISNCIRSYREHQYLKTFKEGLKV